MIDAFLEFASFDQVNVRYVTLGLIFLSIASSQVGVFMLFRKKSLVGDVISHAVFPGIALSFLIIGTKDIYILVAGAFISGLIGVLVMDHIIRYTKLKSDAAMGLVLSVFFGFGIVIFTHIQHSGNASQSGLNTFIFGKAASLIGEDLVVFSVLSLVILALVLLFYREFAIVSFDSKFARSIGIPTGFYEFFLTSLTVLVVVVGIQAVGIILMASIIIAPAVVGRYLTDKLWVMLVFAALAASITAFVASFISYAAPTSPTGPWMVVILSLLAILSMFFSPKKGILTTLRKRIKFKKKLTKENILKTICHILDKSSSPGRAVSGDEIMKARFFSSRKSFKSGMRRLKSMGYLSGSADGWVLTGKGKKSGRRIQRLHRLFELYLTEIMNLPPDHVHQGADSIEHIITPEIEAHLDKILNYPERDPHQSVIPKG